MSRRPKSTKAVTGSVGLVPYWHDWITTERGRMARSARLEPVQRCVERGSLSLSRTSNPRAYLHARARARGARSVCWPAPNSGPGCAPLWPPPPGRFLLSALPALARVHTRAHGKAAPEAARHLPLDGDETVVQVPGAEELGDLRAGGGRRHGVGRHLGYRARCHRIGYVRAISIALWDTCTQRERGGNRCQSQNRC
jgi:hypothetical protein